MTLGIGNSLDAIPKSGGSQTPWTSDIDAAGFALDNLGKITTTNLLILADVINSGAGITLQNLSTGGGGGQTSLDFNDEYGNSFAFIQLQSSSKLFQIYAFGDGLDIYNDFSGTPRLSIAPSTNAVTTTNNTLDDGSGNMVANIIQLTASPTAGYVLTSDGSGVGSWQPVAAGGSQTPWTSNIDAAGYDLTGVNALAVSGGITMNGSALDFDSTCNITPDGAGSMNLTTSNASGYNQLDITSPTFVWNQGDGYTQMRMAFGGFTFQNYYGNVTIGQSGTDSNVNIGGGNLNLDGGNITANTIQLTASPTAGYVLTSDSSGVGSWQVIGMDPDASGGFELGTSSSGSNMGTAVGNSTYAENGGAGFGYEVNAYDYGAGVGFYANGSQYGASMGYSSIGSTYGAAFGYSADGYEYGVAVGNSSVGYFYGAAVGSSALGNGWGAAIGAGADGHGLGNFAAGGNFTGSNAVVPDGWTDTIELGRGTAALQGGLNLRGVGIVDFNGGSPKFIGAKIKLSGLATGTLATPPSGLSSGDVWEDTTTSSTHPILRIKT